MSIKVPFIKRIDTYVIGEILGPFLGGLLFFSFIFLMFQALRLAESFIVHGASGAVLIKMISLMILSFLPTALPISFLIGVLVGFGRLSSDSELVAMKANGMSIHRLIKPILALAVVVAFLSLALNAEWVPLGDRDLKKTLIRLTNTKAIAAVREGTFTSGFFDLLIYADKVDTRTNRLQKVFIYDERDQKNPLTVIAREGEVVSIKSDSDLGASAALKLYDGSIHSNNLQAGTYQKIDFREYQLFLKVEAGADTATIKPRMYPSTELKQFIGKDPDPAHVREFSGEIWRRYAIALAPLIFVFMGAGFGTVRTRAVRSGAALITIIIMTIYWSIQVACTKGVHSGVLNSVVGMLIPDLLMGVIAWRAYRTATW